MACEAPIFIDDEGTIFRLTIQECVNDALADVDISSQTAMSFIFRKPDGSLLPVTPVFTGSGTDGEIEYVTLTGDIDQAGVWCLQAEVTLPTWQGRSSITKFDVDAKLV